MKTIKEFIDFYYKDDESFFITIIDNHTKRIQNYHHNKYTFNNYYMSILNKNKNSSLYFSKNSFYNDEYEDLDRNEYNHIRKTKNNVETIKSIFFDFDEPQTSIQNVQKAIKIIGKPTFIVETSPKKFQMCYMLDDTSNINFIEYELVGKCLARFFDSDISVSSVEKVLRLPFSINRKNNHQTRLLKIEQDVKYSFPLFQNILKNIINEDEDIKTFYQNEYEKMYNKKKIKRDIKKIEKSKSRKTNMKKKNLDLVFDTSKFSNIDIDIKHINMYKIFLNRNQNDASICDIIYIKYRKKSCKDFNDIFDEILTIREKLNKPLKRDFNSYYDDRFELYKSI